MRPDREWTTACPTTLPSARKRRPTMWWRSGEQRICRSVESTTAECAGASWCRAYLAQAVGPCDHGMVNRPIGYWVKRLDAALETHLDSTLGRLRLSRRQWQVLNT